MISVRQADALQRCREVVARLVTLYSAVERLHAASTTFDVCAVIEGILTEQIGAVQYAIFEVDRSGASLNLLSSAGINADLLQEVGWGEGLLGKAAASSRIYVDAAGEGEEAALWEETLNACIPLRVRGRLTGTIAIFGLGPHKREFTPLDLDLFELLSRHAALALMATRRPARTEEEGVTS